MVTDSYYANVVFSDGHNLVTPAKPLLTGTRRAALLAENKIMVAGIRPEQVKQFKTVYLVNSMLELGKVAISTERVYT